MRIDYAKMRKALDTSKLSMWQKIRLSFDGGYIRRLYDEQWIDKKYQTRK